MVWCVGGVCSKAVVQMTAVACSHSLPLWMGCLITAIDTFTFLFLESYGKCGVGDLVGGCVDLYASNEKVPFMDTCYYYKQF